MTIIKEQRIAVMDKELQVLEKEADAKGKDIDAWAEWVDLCELVTQYHFNKRRYTKAFQREYSLKWLIVKRMILV